MGAEEEEGVGEMMTTMTTMMLEGAWVPEGETEAEVMLVTGVGMAETEGRREGREREQRKAGQGVAVAAVQPRGERGGRVKAELSLCPLSVFLMRPFSIMYSIFFSIIIMSFWS